MTGKAQKGWLSRWTRKQWSRHWFVLKNGSLTYYRGPAAELCSFLDGVLDLSLIKHIQVQQQAAINNNNQTSQQSHTQIHHLHLSPNNNSSNHNNSNHNQANNALFTFSLNMWNGECHTLAAATAAERSLWLEAINECTNGELDDDAATDSASSSDSSPTSNLSGKSLDIGRPLAGRHYQLSQQQRKLEQKQQMSLDHLALTLKSAIRRNEQESIFQHHHHHHHLDQHEQENDKQLSSKSTGTNQTGANLISQPDSICASSIKQAKLHQLSTTTTSTNNNININRHHQQDVVNQCQSADAAAQSRQATRHSISVKQQDVVNKSPANINNNNSIVVKQQVQSDPVTNSNSNSKMNTNNNNNNNNINSSQLTANEELQRPQTQKCITIQKNQLLTSQKVLEANLSSNQNEKQHQHNDDKDDSQAFKRRLMCVQTSEQPVDQQQHPLIADLYSTSQPNWKQTSQLMTDSSEKLSLGESNQAVVDQHKAEEMDQSQSDPAAPPGEQSGQSSQAECKQKKRVTFDLSLSSHHLLTSSSDEDDDSSCESSLSSSNLDSSSLCSSSASEDEAIEDQPKMDDDKVESAADTAQPVSDSTVEHQPALIDLIDSDKETTFSPQQPVEMDERESTGGESIPNLLIRRKLLSIESQQVEEQSSSELASHYHKMDTTVIEPESDSNQLLVEPLTEPHQEQADTRSADRCRELEVKLDEARQSISVLEAKLGESYANYGQLESSYKSLQSDLMKAEEMQKVRMQTRVNELSRDLADSQAKLSEAREKLAKYEQQLVKSNNSSQHSKALNWLRSSQQVCLDSQLHHHQPPLLLMHHVKHTMAVNQQALGQKLLIHSRQIQRKLNELELKVDKIQSTTTTTTTTTPTASLVN